MALTYMPSIISVYLTLKCTSTGIGAGVGTDADAGMFVVWCACH